MLMLMLVILNSYFNSIKVRLELVRFSVNKRIVDFNSIKVRLEQSSLTQISRGFSYFNSIKVRLELVTKKWFDMILSFQFHKGAIRTNDAC